MASNTNLSIELFIEVVFYLTIVIKKVVPRKMIYVVVLVEAFNFDGLVAFMSFDV